MIELLQTYSMQDIVMFIIILALAIKSLITFLEWAYERIKKIFNKKHDSITKEQELQERLRLGDETMNKLQKNQEKTDEILQKLSLKIDMLIDSDKDAIKSYITRQHHYFCYQLKWIDDFSLDCLEKRYKHYAAEGGNSFIEDFMKELRALPKQPPTA